MDPNPPAYPTIPPAPRLEARARLWEHLPSRISLLDTDGPISITTKRSNSDSIHINPPRTSVDASTQTDITFDISSAELPESFAKGPELYHLPLASREDYIGIPFAPPIYRPFNKNYAQQAKERIYRRFRGMADLFSSIFSEDEGIRIVEDDPPVLPPVYKVSGLGMEKFLEEPDRFEKEMMQKTPPRRLWTPLPTFVEHDERLPWFSPPSFPEFTPSPGRSMMRNRDGLQRLSSLMLDSEVDSPPESPVLLSTPRREILNIYEWCLHDSDVVLAELDRVPTPELEDYLMGRLAE